MNILYLDLGMGAAGDMLTAALLDLLDKKEQQQVLDIINGLNLHDVRVRLDPAQKCGIIGSHFSVTVNGEEESSKDFEASHHDHHEHEHGDGHSHNSLADILFHVNKLPVEEKVKEDIRNVYQLLAEAESKVHGTSIDNIHFHEVGSLDALVDITSVCILMDHLGVDKVYASPVHVGAGKVRCAHGVLPVPAPATAMILKDVPIYGGKIQSELCTPTGAALLRYFVDSFGDMPVMSVSSVGYGMGHKDFEVANCVRAMLGTVADKKDRVCQLSFNVDDMTPEEISFAMNLLMENGALDVFVVPVTMKKSRPGHLITVLCNDSGKHGIVADIMKYTSTLGIREEEVTRYTLDRHIETVESKYGPIRKKVSTGYGITKEKYEYEDLAKVARENNISLREVKNSI